MRDQNTPNAGLKSRFRGDPLKCFDRLPADLRRAPHESTLDWCPLEVRWSLNKRVKSGVPEHEAIALELNSLMASETEEIARFRYRWPARFSPGYPHTCAGATIMRYDEQDVVRQRRRRG